MAEQPDNLILVQLREIRATLAEHGSMLSSQSKALTEIQEEVRGLKRMAQIALGTTSGADFIAERAEKLAEVTSKRLDGLIAALKRKEIDVDA